MAPLEAAELPPLEGSVLVVDDSRTERRLLRARLNKLGHAVVEAASGEEALAALAQQRIALVISDWMMPGLDGPGLCRAIRSDHDYKEDAYIYIILLTAKRDKAAIAAGFAAGADDFLSKPVDTPELAARIQAGIRLVQMQRRLLRQKADLEIAYGAVKTLYDRIDTDLRVASLLQREVEPPPFARVNGFGVGALFRPAGHVGGDHVGAFPIGRSKIGVLAIDVSGHGIASALYAVRLSQIFERSPEEASLVQGLDARGRAIARDPAEVIRDLNDRSFGSEGHDLFFTMAYAVIDRQTGAGRLCRAGHAEPAILRRCGAVEFLTAGGPPVGLFSGAAYASIDFRLMPGERLMLYSDGLTEATRADRSMIETAGLGTALVDCHSVPTNRFLGALMGALEAEIDRDAFDDDVSAILVERDTDWGQDGDDDPDDDWRTAGPVPPAEPHPLSPTKPPPGGVRPAPIAE